MDLYMRNRIPVSELNIEDLNNFPIWTWEDDHEYIIPLLEIEYIPNDYDAVFVSCEIITPIGYRIYGAVSVRMSNHEVYVISFPDEGGKLLDIPLQPLFASRKEIQVNKLCTIMNKKIDELSPVKFRTSFKFSNGLLLKGLIYL